MKKLSYLLFAGALSSMVLFNSCTKDEEEDVVVTPDECAAATFPANTGSAAVSILNFSSTSGNFTTIDASAGDILSFAVQVTKGTNRPQDFRVYFSDCENTKGTQTGEELDLRNTDAAQTKQFTYEVPTGYSTLYLNIEVDESGSTYTYKRIKLNISGSGIVDVWTNELGASGNDAASRMSSGTGQAYKSCDAAANMEFVDITYGVGYFDGKSYLCSNPARFKSPVEQQSTTPSNCGEGADGSLSTAGGTATYFKEYTGADYESITDAQLSALTVSNTNAEYVNIATTGTVYEFLNSKGKKGLIKVTGGTLNDNSKSINVEVKVQR